MMNDDELRTLRNALHQERDMTLADCVLRAKYRPDEEPNWLGPCLELMSEVDRLRAELVTLHLRPPMSCVTCENHNGQLVERIVRMCMTVCPECITKVAFVDAQKWPLSERPDANDHIEVGIAEIQEIKNP